MFQADPIRPESPICRRISAPSEEGEEVDVEFAVDEAVRVERIDAATLEGEDTIDVSRVPESKKKSSTWNTLHHSWP